MSRTFSWPDVILVSVSLTITATLCAITQLQPGGHWRRKREARSASPQQRRGLTKSDLFARGFRVHNVPKLTLICVFCRL